MLNGSLSVCRRLKTNFDFVVLRRPTVVDNDPLVENQLFDKEIVIFTLLNTIFLKTFCNQRTPALVDGVARESVTCGLSCVMHSQIMKSLLLCSSISSLDHSTYVEGFLF